MHDEYIPDVEHMQMGESVCVLIYEAVVKVDNVIVRTNPARIYTCMLTCVQHSIAIEIILSFRSPYFVD